MFSTWSKFVLINRQVTLFGRTEGHLFMPKYQSVPSSLAEPVITRFLIKVSPTYLNRRRFIAQLNISQRSGRGVAHLLALVYSSQQCSTAAPWRTSRFTTTRPFAGQLLARPLCTEAAEPKPVAFPTPSPSQQQMKKHPLQHLGQIRRLPQFQQTLEYMFNLERIWDASGTARGCLCLCGCLIFVLTRSLCLWIASEHHI